jgi:Protein of unknown function (DUF3106)
MASRKDLEATSLWGKAARRVSAGLLLLCSLPVLAFGRPGPPPQAPSPRTGSTQHLGPWLQGHGSLPPQQQERALRSEPGFNRLNPQAQQKLMDRMHQLDRMPPAQRQRTVDHIEAMERLSPQMRQQVRTSVQQFHSLPPDRQVLVKKAFRDLRAYPPDARAAMMRSSRFASQFTPQERGILGNVLTLEPYQPGHLPPPPSGGVGYAR